MKPRSDRASALQLDLLDSDPEPAIDATFAGSWRNCSATMKLRTAGGSEPNRMRRPRCISESPSTGASTSAMRMPVTGQTMPPITPMCQSFQRTSKRRTPSEISITGISASPTILMPKCAHSGIGGWVMAKAKPSTVAHTMGLRRNCRTLA